MAEILFENVKVRELLPGQSNTAAFFTLDNRGDKAVTIVAASSPAAKVVEIHQHLHEDGMMKMRQLASLTIAAGETVVFKSGSYHLMLFNISVEYLQRGEIELVLSLEGGGSISTIATVTRLISAH